MIHNKYIKQIKFLLLLNQIFNRNWTSHKTSNLPSVAPYSGHETVLLQNPAL